MMKGRCSSRQQRPRTRSAVHRRHDRYGEINDFAARALVTHRSSHFGILPGRKMEAPMKKLTYLASVMVSLVLPALASAATNNVILFVADGLRPGMINIGCRIPTGAQKRDT
jgi:hypothetical protein